ncbi:MAG TPA: alpha-N-arabinofuranosidase [Micromonosporaceae bacterium]|jgi:alpha-N-arabinofuranosidase|nr:alpha-N-arabinofuranosidase [Micromonosporaceae bacterium]
MDSGHLEADVVLDPDSRVAEVNRRLFGSFVEHMGRCVYGGVFEPGHPTADELGLRGDVLALTRELGVTVVRYPGGNFVSSYRWEDGVGPVGERPKRLNLAWHSLESNAFGLNEFITWARAAGAEPMMTVNLGTRGVQEACDLLEYCNHPSGTQLSDLRRKHGFEEPHRIRLWCLGNELDGPWQVGHKTPLEYARLANETAKAMRLIDPGIELVAAGSSNSLMPTYGEWEATVLEHGYEAIDYIALHHYFDPGEDTPVGKREFLTSGVVMDRYIEGAIATCDHIGAKLGSRKRIQLAFDEWNVWYMHEFSEPPDRPWTLPDAVRPDLDLPPLIEDDFTATDAVVVGDMLLSLLRHADRVTVANQAQLVNVIAPIRTRPGGPAWRQSIFHPFALTSRLARGVVLRTEVKAPPHDAGRRGEVPLLSVVATYDEETGGLVLFAVNRAEQPMGLRVDLRSLPNHRFAEHITLHPDADPGAVNTPEAPDRIRPATLTPATVDGGRVTVPLPSTSWNALRFTTPPTS